MEIEYRDKSYVVTWIFGLSCIHDDNQTEQKKIPTNAFTKFEIIERDRPSTIALNQNALFKFQFGSRAKYAKFHKLHRKFQNQTRNITFSSLQKNLSWCPTRKRYCSFFLHAIQYSQLTADVLTFDTCSTFIQPQLSGIKPTNAKPWGNWSQRLKASNDFRAGQKVPGGVMITEYGRFNV
ncbi:hypothetical protein AGLY_005068 [Aphis glycines]|uniref:Uncharacterized protein n=1 Tax=Aphis glycines TaxID=307491 RepID=A0A6G0TWY7_APHGL|nr:hypothetical protein AGLY_005068 [Aphis glycines]